MLLYSHLFVLPGGVGGYGPGVKNSARTISPHPSHKSGQHEPYWNALSFHDVDDRIELSNSTVTVGILFLITHTTFLISAAKDFVDS